MKRTLLCILTVLAACALLAGCRRANTSAGSTSSTTQLPVATATPEPTPTLPPYEPNILTGAPRDESYVADQRPTAIMVNNIVAARPQRGLSGASILFEIKVEGGITRFMPVYLDYNQIGEIGPVRSGRDQFFQLILPWQMFYGHEGQSVVMQQYAVDYSYGTLNLNDAGNRGYRDFTRQNWRGQSYNNGLSYEHTLYLTSDNIRDYIESNNVDMHRPYNSTYFNFVDYRQENPVRDLTSSLDSDYSTNYGPVVTDGEYVEIKHSDTYQTRFIYDAASNNYLMQQNYSDGSWRNTVDESNDTQLAFTNVLVLYTDIYTYPGHTKSDLQYVEYSWGGIGYYCYGGKREMVYWQKGTPLEALRLFYLTPDGKCSDTPLELNIGKTYVAVADNDFTGNFVARSLEGVDLQAYGIETQEGSYTEDVAQEGQTLGMSTDEMTNSARATGQTEAQTQPQAPTTPAEPQAPAEPAPETPSEPAADVPAEPAPEAPAEPAPEAPAEPAPEAPADDGINIG